MIRVRMALCDKCVKADKCQLCGNLQHGACKPCDFDECRCGKAMTTMALKDEMLVRAMVLLKGINECYEFPKVKAWLQRYDGLVGTPTKVMDEA